MKKTRLAEAFRVIAGGVEFEFEAAEEGGYTVTVPALPGCISEGDSFEEALADARDALEGCLVVGPQAGATDTPAPPGKGGLSPSLPILKPRELIRALERAGFQVDHQTGSHVILYKVGHPQAISVPRQAKDLKRPTQERIVKDAGFALEDFSQYL